MVQWCNLTLECEEKESEEVSRHVNAVAVLYSRGLCGGGTMFTNPQGTCSSVLRLSEHHLIP